MENAKMQAEQPTVLLSLKNRMKESVVMLREINSGMETIERRLSPQNHDEKKSCEKAPDPIGILDEIDDIQMELNGEVQRYKRLHERFIPLL